MEKLLHNVGDLSSPARSAVEALMGHPLRDDQQLYIVALDAAAEPTALERSQSWSELQSILGTAHENARQLGATPEEIERTIDQACDEVRYGQKPCG